MSKIASKHTKPEVFVRKTLHRAGFRFRLHDRKLPGSPDIVLPKFKTVIFVNGCFWHRHQHCSLASTPSNNHAFWQAKFERNLKRDQDNHAQLERMGWEVSIVWTCELKNKKQRDHRMASLLNQINLRSNKAR